MGWDFELHGLIVGVKHIGGVDAQAMLDSARRAGASAEDRTRAAIYLEFEDGIPELTEAESLLLDAAEQGYIPAAVLYGEMAYRDQNYATAYSWLNLAASRRAFMAWSDLGRFLSNQIYADQAPCIDSLSFARPTSAKGE